jgi:hypothetical protein
VEGLDAALARARQAHDDEREMMRVRADVATDRNRLRKVSPASMASGRATETLVELDWWGIPRPCDFAEAERAKHLLLARLEQREAGSPGYAEWRAAGYELLRFWIESGNVVTATKLNQSRSGGEYKPSAAVAFLAEQLPHVVPGLGREGALAAAYTIARAWLDEKLPHWTAVVPQPPRKPGGIG